MGLRRGLARGPAQLPTQLGRCALRGPILGGTSSGHQASALLLVATWSSALGPPPGCLGPGISGREHGVAREIPVLVTLWLGPGGRDSLAENPPQLGTARSFTCRVQDPPRPRSARQSVGKPRLQGLTLSSCWERAASTLAPGPVLLTPWGAEGQPRSLHCGWPRTTTASPGLPPARCPVPPHTTPLPRIPTPI